ncbi:hypothetical protein [Pseudomonas alkylphenolica]|uniref:hypothetical protein n=1 Tax=Pseudomonas alkylphenolica TaxID=237609 RepID=UPI0018D7CE7E|nr:hypothetical protein [Pseudomonas alkylphenolica]MBH3430216.1 hypothetical protein [Pseudomonas alkylphenolica]
MVAVIGIVVALIGFAMMSRPFRIGFALYLAFLAYYIYLYGGKGDLAEASTALSLVSGAVGLLVLGAVLGGIRSSAGSESEYIAKRKRVFMFLLKFGGAYVVFTQLLTVAFFLGGGGRSWDDWTAAGFVVKLLPYKWVGFLLMLGGYYWLKGRAKTSRALRT